jgi:hypothetical protein
MPDGRHSQFCETLENDKDKREQSQDREFRNMLPCVSGRLCELLGHTVLKGTQFNTSMR